MTLRLRLVAALVVLLTVGLAVFGVTTYVFYSRAQHDRLDEELSELASPVGALLVRRLVYGDESSGGYDPGPGPGGPSRLPGPSSYVAEIRSRASGAVVGESLVPVDTDDRPDLPDELGFDGTSQWMTVGSTDGGTTDWRVLVTRADDIGGDPDRPDPFRGMGEVADDYFVVVAVPTTGVESSLARLAAIELVAASSLLVLLAAGSWLVLRRGLRPLEQMAATAGSITAGDLSTRVGPADGRSEVGQLGLAIDTMLGRLEGAFAEQEATEQRLRQFLADAAHELRTPLTSIQGFAELFRLGAGHDEVDLAVTLRRIEQESGRMRHLVDDLLLLARLDETRPLERRPVDLAVVAADACTDAVAVDPGRAVTLDAPTPVVVPGDDDHLRQAVANLVANAVRHTPAGTAIEVQARRDDEAGEAVVRVRDHGPGLPAEALDHAFDRFWQADPSRADAGAGLGLSIVAAIAAEHGGRATVANAVDATDTGGAGGAVFTLHLPLDPTDGPRRSEGDRDRGA